MHLSSDIALDLIDGRLAKDEATFWKEHLEGCRACLQDIGQWRQLRADLKRSHLKSATAEIIDTVTEFFPPGDEKEARHPCVKATVVFDTYRDATVANVRGTAVASRQLVLRAEDFDIHIKIWGGPDHRQMLGQLLPRGTPKFVGTARFHLLQTGERLETATIDEIAEFHSTDVPEGELSLQTDVPNLTVVGAVNVREAQ